MPGYDVIVIGVGAMGAAACYHLARRGHRVLGLEQFAIAHPYGSSGGHTRMIRLAYYEHPDYVPLLRRAYALWEALERETGQRVLFKTGGIYMGPADGPVVSGTLQAARAHHLAHDLLTRDQLARAYPAFQVPENHVGVHEPEAGFVLCERAIALHAKLAMEAGAHIHAHEPVLRIEHDEGAVHVATGQGLYSADRLIVCGGAWTSKLIRPLGVELMITRQSLAWVWPADPEPFRLGRFPVWGVEAMDGSLSYGFPILDDFPGLKVARHGRGPMADADSIDRQPMPADRREAMEILAHCLPGAGGPFTALRICMYSNSPDGHFIVDRLPGQRNITIACGFSGHGYKFAPVIGEALADLAIEGRSPLPVEFLGLKRFAAAG